MKCQVLFSLKNKKINFSISSATILGVEVDKNTRIHMKCQVLFSLKNKKINFSTLYIVCYNFENKRRRKRRIHMKHQVLFSLKDMKIDFSISSATILLSAFKSSQWAHNVKMTSYQRRCDVITSHRRWYDVILMLCACWATSLCANSADDKLTLFLIFQESRIWHLMQIVSVAWNGKICFLGKIRKHVSIWRLLKPLPGKLSVNRVKLKFGQVPFSDLAPN